MPELPEVETTLRGVAPFVCHAAVREVIIRQARLRREIPDSLAEIEGRRIIGAGRRAKYLLFQVSDGSTLLIHLGMSGSLRVTRPDDEWRKHDHFALSLDNGRQLRLHDPRRFGLVLRLTGPPENHPLLCDLGPEPLEDAFHPEFLRAKCARRAAAIKTVIMDAKTVVGVGNIYASESLFAARIHPLTPANRLGPAKLRALTEAIRDVLTRAIGQGGTTLRDFVQSDGTPGYFAISLAVYGRGGEPCPRCGARIRQSVIAQRSSYWCPKCQRPPANRTTTEKTGR